MDMECVEMEGVNRSQRMLLRTDLWGGRDSGSRIVEGVFVTVVVVVLEVVTMGTVFGGDVIFIVVAIFFTVVVAMVVGGLSWL
jgi:hypothetical protein